MFSQKTILEFVFLLIFIKETLSCKKVVKDAEVQIHPQPRNVKITDVLDSKFQDIIDEVYEVSDGDIDDRYDNHISTTSNDNWLSNFRARQQANEQKTKDDSNYIQGLIKSIYVGKKKLICLEYKRIQIQNDFCEFLEKSASGSANLFHDVELLALVSLILISFIK